VYIYIIIYINYLSYISLIRYLNFLFFSCSLWCFSQHLHSLAQILAIAFKKEIRQYTKRIGSLLHCSSIIVRMITRLWYINKSELAILIIYRVSHFKHGKYGAPLNKKLMWPWPELNDTIQDKINDTFLWSLPNHTTFVWNIFSYLPFWEILMHY